MLMVVLGSYQWRRMQPLTRYIGTVKFMIAVISILH